jgi:hypothetical protein
MPSSGDEFINGTNMDDIVTPNIIFSLESLDWKGASSSAANEHDVFVEGTCARLKCLIIAKDCYETS